MSTKRVELERLRHGAPSRQPLPVDLLLEVVVRSDAAAVIVCAVASKILRCAIVDPAFCRRLAGRAAASGGFDPALLLGVSYREMDYYTVVTTPRVIRTQLCARLDAAGALPHSFKPVASRDGLLVLRREPWGHVLPEDLYGELRVYDTLTGHVTSLPPMTLPAVYPHALLSVGDGGRTFELLIVKYYCLEFQTFSSKDGQWSAVRDTSISQTSVTEHYGSPAMGAEDGFRPAVIGRTVYWLNGSWGPIIALDVGAAEATFTWLPPRCLSRMMDIKQSPHLHLASVRGQLRLLVAESRGIAMWTLTPATAESAATWSWQVVIGRPEIERQAGLDKYGLKFCFMGFGERSGAVILHGGDDGELLRLDLGSKEALVGRLSSTGTVWIKRLFLHEIDLVSLLRAMKSFSYSEFQCGLRSNLQAQANF